MPKGVNGPWHENGPLSCLDRTQYLLDPARNILTLTQKDSDPVSKVDHVAGQGDPLTTDVFIMFRFPPGVVGENDLRLLAEKFHVLEQAVTKAGVMMRVLELELKCIKALLERERSYVVKKGRKNDLVDCFPPQPHLFGQVDREPGCTLVVIHNQGTYQVHCLGQDGHQIEKGAWGDLGIHRSSIDEKKGRSRSKNWPAE